MTREELEELDEETRKWVTSFWYKFLFEESLLKTIILSIISALITSLLTILTIKKY